MIEDALDITRLENNNFTLFYDRFDIRAVCNEVADIMKFQVDSKGLFMKINVAQAVPNLIHSDRKRLKQVLFNLIGNALKFTYRGGITVDVQREAGNIKVAVLDTGIGIKQEDISKLFKFFGQVSTTKSINKSGMGLGLTISSMIIQ